MRKLILLALLFCGCGKPHERIPIGAVEKSLDGASPTTDGFTQRKYDFPPGTTNINYLGRGWWEFTHKNKKLLLRNHGRSSTMTVIEEEE